MYCHSEKVNAMATATESSLDENETNDLENEEKKSTKKLNYRKRKKHHYNSIRNLMEFYFGDANLSRDRFLRQQINKDPYVPLDMFLTFNKMKDLTLSTEEIGKSLSNSDLLELDESQQKVRRKIPLPLDYNTDDQILYVEALPPTANHDWVKKIFERFGPIEYISIPKYFKSKKIKEFCFIQFKEEASVEKAIKAFQEFNGVLNMQETDPSELQSIKSFIKEQNETDDDLVFGEYLDALEEQNLRKRNIQEDIDEDRKDEPSVKKIKIEEELSRSVTDAKDVKIENDSEKSSPSDGDNEKSDDNLDEEGKENVVKVKRRKLNKKMQKIKKEKIELSLSTNVTYLELKILPKRDWKRLRNKYLNLQREKMGKLKREAHIEKAQGQEQTNDNLSEKMDDGNAVASVPKQSKSKERKIQKMNMNFYGAGDDEQQQAMAKKCKPNVALDRTPLFTYQPGLIVEVGFMKPCVQVKEFKTDMRQYSTVKYVDIKEGAIFAHLRLESSTAAEEFVRQINCAEYKTKILSGDAESEYWKKIEKDREMKLNKLVKVSPKRGRQKIKKIIANHIRFEEDDNERQKTQKIIVNHKRFEDDNE